MADVLLTHSYHVPFDRKQLRKMQPYPPLGTLYSAALLRRHNYSVALFDTMTQRPGAAFVECLKRENPEVVAIYEDNFNFLTKMCLSRMREVAWGMIDAAKAHGCKVLVNGSDASDHAQQYLDRGADFVLLGEAEETLLETVDCLLRGADRNPCAIRGLAYKSGNGGASTKTAPRPLMRDLNRLALPARDLVDMDRYRSIWREAHGFFSLNVAASRGCPYGCNWCAKPIYGDSYHLRSTESIALEMLELKDKYGAEHLWFADDLFGINSRWIHDFAAQVETHQAEVPFKIQTRADLMNRQTAAALARAGCVEAWMGVESGSQKILDAMQKGLKVGQITVARDALAEHNIRACYFLQFGYPGETWDDISRTIEMVRETRPDDIGVSVSYPLPGTKFHARVREELGEKTHWVDSEDLSMMFRGTYTSEFYRALRDALHAEIEIWSPAGNWRFDLREPSASSGSIGLAGRWAAVEGLEGTCKNAEPTFLQMQA